jgi:cobalt-zinc-cadmium efflux system protein
VHDLHIWPLISNTIAPSAHVVIYDMSQWVFVLKGLQNMLKQSCGIEHVTLQPETEALF